jgi:F0F1-type ATP synthase delta subunit
MDSSEEKSDVNENEKTVEEQARHPVPPDILEKVYRIREQLLRENKGQIFEDSAEAVRRMREERTRELEARIRWASKPLTREKLERVLKVREEIMQDRKGKPFEYSTEIIRQMREERSRELGDL